MNRAGPTKNLSLEQRSKIIALREHSSKTYEEISSEIPCSASDCFYFSLKYITYNTIYMYIQCMLLFIYSYERCIIGGIGINLWET